MRKKKRRREKKNSLLLLRGRVRALLPGKIEKIGNSIREKAVRGRASGESPITEMRLTLLH